MTAIWAWICANIGTIIICAALVAVIILVILWMINDNKKGNCSCGGSCGTCGMNCHNKKI